MTNAEGTTRTAAPRTRGWLDAALDFVERVGNRLPDQVTIFASMAAIVLVLSAVIASAGFEVRHPVTGLAVRAVSLLDRSGLQWVVTSVVTNFTSFPPLGVVLVAMVGVGVAERAGLFAAFLKGLVIVVPRFAVTPTVVFAGVMSNVASDAGYLVLPPLCAMLYASLGRHPLAGVAAVFAGVAGGFSANLLVSTLDPMLAGLTQDAARVFAPGYEVHAACNYYFLAASTILLTLVGWWVSDRIVEKRLGPWTGGPATTNSADHAEMSVLSRVEVRGMIAAVAAVLCTLALIALFTLPADGIFRKIGAKPEELWVQRFDPLLKSIVPLILLLFLVPGLAFGIAVGKIRSDKDAARMMHEVMSTMGPYIVIAFFASQFVAWFRQSNLGLMLAIGGGELLRDVGFTGVPLMVTFVAFAALINLLISSASAKWAMMAPVFVPMFMTIGLSPEMTQALYRVGDSSTNTITPLNTYIPILLVVVRRYVPGAGLGTLMATMMPYAVAFFLAWLLFAIVWGLADLPLGPGVSNWYTVPATGN